MIIRFPPKKNSLDRKKKDKNLTSHQKKCWTHFKKKLECKNKKNYILQLGFFLLMAIVLLSASVKRSNLYWSYYPRRSRELVSPVSRIFWVCLVILSIVLYVVFLWGRGTSKAIGKFSLQEVFRQAIKNLPHSLAYITRA